MSWLSSFQKKAAPYVAQYSPDPVTRAVASAYVANENRKQESHDRKVAEERQQREQKEMAEIFGTGDVSSIQQPVRASSTQTSGQGGFMGGVGEFFSSAGNFLGNIFGGSGGSVFGGGRPRGVAQQPAITTTTNLGAQESQGSGSIQAGMGVGLAPLVNIARNFLKGPVGTTAIGTGAGLGISMLGDKPMRMRVTRKMKAQARSLLNMTGGNLAMTANFLGISEQELVMILLKRFRNDGPVVTKAALRKTKSTVRKLKHMCDMYDDLRPAARRRTPMRKRSSTTTLIKN
jgi:hypothetical protein